MLHPYLISAWRALGEIFFLVALPVTILADLLLCIAERFCGIRYPWSWVMAIAAALSTFCHPSYSAASFAVAGSSSSISIRFPYLSSIPWPITFPYSHSSLDDPIIFDIHIQVRWNFHSCILQCLRACATAIVSCLAFALQVLALAVVWPSTVVTVALLLSVLMRRPA